MPLDVNVLRLFYEKSDQKFPISIHLTHNRKYFGVYEVPIKRENHPDFVTLKILVTQKGLAFLHKIFESELSDRKLAKIR